MSCSWEVRKRRKLILFLRFVLVAFWIDRVLSLSLSLSFLEHNISHIKEVLNELYSYGSLAAALVLCNHLGIVLMLSMQVTSFMGGAKKLWKSILHDFEPVTSSSV
jgi:hypothetical protein